jgi:hypothetical protein
MGKFDAASAVDPLEYDFTKYGGSSGTIPEPTTKQVESFMNAAIEIAGELGLTPGKPVSMDEIAGMSKDVAEQMNSQMTVRVLALCGDTITAEDLDKLPYRVKAAFIAWLAGELNPESRAPGTTR